MTEKNLCPIFREIRKYTSLFSLTPPSKAMIVLALIFIVLIPITEWPDAVTNISRSADGLKFYPTHATDILVSIGSQSDAQYNFFNDQFLFSPKLEYFLFNLIRLPIITLMVIVICGLAQKNHDFILPLAPPLVFSLCSPSQEAIAIFILVSAFFIPSKHKVIIVLLCMLSIYVDRSMAPNACFLALITISSHLRLLAHSPKWVIPISVIVVFLTQKYAAIDISNSVDFHQFNLLGISQFDIESNSDFGKNNLYALASSLMGLYGSMSIRPFPLWLYYPVIILLFIFGFLKSDWSRRSFFLSLLIISYITLWLLPPVSQARYYPLLTLSFWGIIFSGIKFFKINPIKIYMAIIVSTFLGCLTAIFKNYA
jgi:hypothetical protein